MLSLTACANTLNHRPLSETEYYQVDFSELAPERWWGDEIPKQLDKLYRQSTDNLLSRFEKEFIKNPAYIPVSNYLVLSGGSANGAFGVGILSGWSEAGTRPEFDYVTGISTGAIMAPMAFLGSDYDETLTEAYISITRENIFKTKFFTSIILGASIADTKPLKNLIEEHITEELVLELAVEKKRGRTLVIQTTQFDALRSMVWDITAIAENRGAEGAPLIRQIILASAAVPGLFPPVLIEWEDEGRKFTELHVDGAVSSQVYAYPPQLHLFGT